MNAQPGVHWVRAVQFDAEVRADWERYIGELIQDYQLLMRDERDEIKLRWLQGKLQAIEALIAFVEQTMVEYRKLEQAEKN